MKKRTAARRQSEHRKTVSRGIRTKKDLDALPVVKTVNIWSIEVEEGETAFTGDPGRPSEKCTGCMSCMAACALFNQGMVATALSGIRIYHHTAEWTLRRADKLYTYAVCRQCPGLPPCDVACPVHAHYRDDRTGAVLIDDNSCIRCGKCVEACPYGACSLSRELNKIIKCTLCDSGSDGPQCVTVCPSMILKMNRLL